MQINALISASSLMVGLLGPAQVAGQQPAAADVPAIAAQIVASFAEQAAGLPTARQIVVPMATLREASRKLGSGFSASEVAAALPPNVVSVERPETAVSQDQRQVYLVGDPFVISVRSLESRNGAVHARVEIAFNGSPQSPMRITGSVYLLELRRLGGSWIVVSKKVVGQA